MDVLCKIKMVVWSSKRVWFSDYFRFRFQKGYKKRSVPRLCMRACSVRSWSASSSYETSGYYIRVPSEDKAATVRPVGCFDPYYLSHMTSAERLLFLEVMLEFRLNGFFRLWGRRMF